MEEGLELCAVSLDRALTGFAFGDTMEWVCCWEAADLSADRAQSRLVEARLGEGLRVFLQRLPLWS